MGGLDPSNLRPSDPSELADAVAHAVIAGSAGGSGQNGKKRHTQGDSLELCDFFHLLRREILFLFMYL